MIRAMVWRNVRLFFRDRLQLFFSVLGVLIIILLYVLFLGDVVTANMPGEKGTARFLTDSWVMAGVLAVTPYTAALGAMGIMLDDRIKKARKDFLSSPFSRGKLAAGYMIGTFATTIVMCLAALILAEVYIVMYGGQLLGLSQLLQVLGVMLLSVLSSSGLMFFVVSFLKTSSSYSTISTLLGTLIGFVTGVYIPMGQLPPAVQSVAAIFPPTHGASLLRRIMMEAPLSQAMAGAPAPVVTEFHKMMGSQLYFAEKTVSPLFSVLFIAASILLFYMLSVWRLQKKDV